MIDRSRVSRIAILFTLIVGLLASAGTTNAQLKVGGPAGLSVQPFHAIVPLVGCNGSGCTGRNASSEGCTGTQNTTGSAAVRDYLGRSYGTVYVRYSPLCNAKWAQYIPSSNPAVWYSYTWIGNNAGALETATCAWGNCTTPMVGGSSGAYGETEANFGTANGSFGG